MNCYEVGNSIHQLRANDSKYNYKMLYV
jgi:hypothetical protein